MQLVYAFRNRMCALRATLLANVNTTRLVAAAFPVLALARRATVSSLATAALLHTSVGERGGAGGALGEEKHRARARLSDREVVKTLRSRFGSV